MTRLERGAAALFLLAAALFALMMVRVSAERPSAPSFAVQAGPPPVVPSPVTFEWQAPPDGPRPSGYRMTVDATTEDAGSALTYKAVLPPGPHRATVASYTPDGLTSGPSNALDFVVATPPADPCSGHPVTIAVKSFTDTVKAGLQGQVLFDLINPFPVTMAQVKLGAQVVSQMTGTDLRASAGIKFSVPRTPGAYPMAVQAMDSANCQGGTSALRTVTVTP